MDLFLSESQSLKGKRHILKGVKERVRNNFNVSISEIDANGLWQNSVLGVAVVANDGKHANRVLNKVINHVEADIRVELIGVSMEML